MPRAPFTAVLLALALSSWSNSVDAEDTPQAKSQAKSNGVSPATMSEQPTQVAVQVPPRPDADPWEASRMVRGNEAPGYVTFTFDDGPDLESTPRILETLEHYQVPGTFFVVGRRFVGKKPQAVAGAKLLKEIRDRGFAVGNHTSRHENLKLQSDDEARKAIQKNAEDIRAVLGEPVHLFRPPFGAANGAVVSFLRRRRDTLVRWNIDPHDFQKANRKHIRDKVLRGIVEKNGGVVLLHDTKDWTADALPEILEGLELANCQRLASGQSPIIPTTLHYFLRDRDGSPRPVPVEVKKGTEQYIARLSERCQSDD